MHRVKAFTLVELPFDRLRAVSKRKAVGFTLVELLVVIGIIAVLIGVLLPALTAARKQAGAVKCASQLREIGNAFQMYAMENKGYYPPSQLQTVGISFKYNIDGVDYPVPGSGLGAYWFNFLAKYVTKAKMGESSGTNKTDAAIARNTVFWGCSAWDGYRSTAPGDINRVQIGYGMNVWPTFTSTYPTGTGNPPQRETNFVSGWRWDTTANQQGNFIKQRVYGRTGAQRALVCDSRFWALESQPAPASGVIPNQPNVQNSVTYTQATGQTLADLYRHGKFPPSIGNEFSNRGGKVSFNILYCDGHVSTVLDAREAFRATRQRFPG